MNAEIKRVRIVHKHTCSACGQKIWPPFAGVRVMSDGKVKFFHPSHCMPQPATPSGKGTSE